MADTLPTWNLAAETKEFVGPITVTADGSPVTTFEVTVTSGAVRPSNWQPRDVIGGFRGVMVGAGTPFTLEPGRKYSIWTKYSDDPEVPIDRIGYIRAY